MGGGGWGEVEAVRADSGAAVEVRSRRRLTRATSRFSPRLGHNSNDGEHRIEPLNNAFKLIGW